MTLQSLTRGTRRAASAPEWRNAFDAQDLQSHGLTARLVQGFLDNPEWAFRILRRWWPIPRIPFTNWWLVTRFDDVQAVLKHDEAFGVPFGPKVKELNDGPNFLLGMRGDDDYRRYQRQVMDAFRLKDVEGIVAPQSLRVSEGIIERAGGRLDAVQDLITRVPTDLCESYYGVAIPDSRKVEFSQWTFAMSTYMFADPTDHEPYHRAAVAGAERVRKLVDDAIDSAAATTLERGAVVDRLLAMRRDGAEGLTQEVIRAYLIGMMIGFVPTNTMAAGHILEVLLQRGDIMAQARSAALADDDDLLKRCLFEALRFKPLNPGPFRDCVAEFTIGAGFLKTQRFRPGAKLLVGTQSAMFDSRRVSHPGKFDPGRAPSDSMLFGFGLHWCVGRFIAEAQITQTLKALLRKNRLRRADGPEGQLQRLGPFPQHLVVEFER